MLKRNQILIVSVISVLLTSALANAEMIFSENVGTTVSNTPTIDAYTGWQNNGILMFSGLGNIETSTPSNGYSGASGNGNVVIRHNSTNRFLEISGIDTTGFVPGSFDLSFGAFKSSIGSSMTELSLQYSDDGITYTSIPIPLQPTGMGTDVWRLIALNDLSLPTVPNLRLRWTNTSSSTPNFRLDDISLEAIPEPTSLILFGSMLSFFGFRRRRR